MNKPIKISKFLTKKRGVIYNLERKLMDSRKGRLIYLFLYIIGLFMVIGCAIVMGLFDGWIMNQSLIHCPENDNFNYRIGVIFTLIMSAPIWLKIIFNIVRLKIGTNKI
jgi:hypothetical protein